MIQTKKYGIILSILLVSFILLTGAISTNVQAQDNITSNKKDKIFDDINLPVEEKPTKLKIKPATGLIKGLSTPIEYEDTILYSGGSQGHNADIQGKTPSLNEKGNYIVAGAYYNGQLRGKIPLTYSYNGNTSEKVIDFGNVTTNLVAISLNKNDDFIGVVYTTDYTVIPSLTTTNLVFGNIADESTFSSISVPSDVATYANDVELFDDGTYVLAAEINDVNNQTSGILIKGSVQDLKNAIFSSTSTTTTIVAPATADTDYWIDYIDATKDGGIVYRGYSYKNNIRDRLLIGKTNVSDLSSFESSFLGTSDNGISTWSYDVNTSGDFVLYTFQYNVGQSNPKDIMYIGNLSDFSNIREVEIDPAYKIYNRSGCVSLNENGYIILTSMPFASSQEVYLTHFKVDDASFIKTETFDLTQYIKTTINYSLTGHISAAAIDKYGNFVLGGELLVRNDGGLSIPGETGAGGHGYAPYVIVGNVNDALGYTAKVYADPNANNDQSASSSFGTIITIGSEFYAFGARRNSVDINRNDEVALVVKIKFNVPLEVKFDTAGGSLVADQEVANGDLATRPSTNPTKIGYTFDDWYIDAAYSSKYDFTSPITTNTIIYAKFNKNNYTVKFSVNGSIIDANQIVAYKDLAVEPSADPIVKGHSFVDWYTDNTYSTIYDFDTEVTADKILYAKFNINDYVVKFNVDGILLDQNQTVAYQGLATTLTTDPVKVDHTFDGWYIDSTYTIKYDFTSLIEDNITLYGRFIPKDPTIIINPNKPILPSTGLSATLPGFMLLLSSSGILLILTKRRYTKQSKLLN